MRRIDGFYWTLGGLLLTFLENTEEDVSFTDGSHVRTSDPLNGLETKIW